MGLSYLCAKANNRRNVPSSRNYYYYNIYFACHIPRYIKCFLNVSLRETTFILVYLICKWIYMPPVGIYLFRLTNLCILLRIKNKFYMITKRIGSQMKRCIRMHLVHKNQSEKLAIMVKTSGKFRSCTPSRIEHLPLRNSVIGSCANLILA